jgi:hypothetical protein
MKLKLVKLDTNSVKGSYTINGVKGRMPERSLYLHPTVADSFLTHIAPIATVSDIFRTPESSLAAVKSGRGAKPPGYSGHNFGLSIDIDVKKTMLNLGMKNKQELDTWMEDRFWYCHRRDHKMESENWHYNHLGIGIEISTKVKTTAGYIEYKILELYEKDFKQNSFTIQEELARLKLYNGSIDGKLGPISKAAIGAFQRAWNLADSGIADDVTKRTLALVAAEKDLV